MRATPLSLTARTLFAELRELAIGMGVASDMSRKPGSLVTKSVGGHVYLYYQYRDLSGTTRQTYLGPDVPSVRAIAERLGRPTREEEADSRQLQQLRAAFVAAGGAAIETAPMKVLLAFAEAGVFRPANGYGVVVGTLAFHAFGNLLGVQWPTGTRTQDIDVAGMSRIGLAIKRPEQPMPAILEQLDMGFVPVPKLDPRSPSTSFRVRGRDLRVDLLTPATGKPVGTRYVPALDASAQPLRFLDYLIEETIPLPVIGRTALVLVNAPLPERFALHKLLVSVSRDSASASKAEKDRTQAVQLLEVLEEEAPDGVQPAVAALVDRGKAWRSRLQRALERCREDAPHVVELVHGCM